VRPVEPLSVERDGRTVLVLHPNMIQLALARGWVARRARASP
jgi:hypothetical protein